MQGKNWIYQLELFPIVDGNGYKLAKIYMMQCYSAKETAYDYGIEGESKEPIFTNYNKEWSKRAIYFKGYFDLNVLGFDVR